MKNSHIKILVICLFSILTASTAYSRIGFQGEKDVYPDKGGDGRDIVYMAINVGRIIGNMVFTMDDSFTIDKNIRQFKGLNNRPVPYRDSRNMAIVFGVIALLFLIINMYFGGKIVEFIRSRGRKAHYWKLRWMIFSYVNQYKKITISENGQTGPYYWQISVTTILFIIAMAVAVYFAIIS